MKRAAAFSLVELSIVLVILGLLVGGVLSGQALIHAAQLRAVTEEYKSHTVALNTFRDKYFGMPGDLTNATAFWGKHNAKCAGDTGNAATPGTCNGNGDGYLDYGSANGTAEMFQFWKQLGLAGMVSGTYTGTSGPGGGNNTVIGTNVPVSRLNNGGWSAAKTDMAYTGDTYGYDYTNPALYNINNYHFGLSDATYDTFYPVMTSEDLWNIDKKIDDGMPAKGIVIAQNWTDCTTSASKTDFNGQYKFSVTGNVCAMIIKIK